MASSTKDNSSKNTASTEFTAECCNRTHEQTSNNNSERSSDRSVHFDLICCSTKQQDTPGVESASTEHLCGNKQVQNGGLNFTTLNPTGKRLHDEVRLEGRLHFHSCGRGTQEVSSVHFQRCPIRIPMPAIWVVDSTTDVYKSPETSDRTVETTGNASDYLPRRPSVTTSRSQGTSETISRSMPTAEQPGIYYQEREMLSSSSAILCLPRCSDQLIEHDPSSTFNEATGATARSTIDEGEKSMSSSGTVSSAVSNDTNVEDRNWICTSSLQKLTTAAHQVNSQVRNPSPKTTHFSHAGSYCRLGMVDIRESNGGELGTDNRTDAEHNSSD